MPAILIARIQCQSRSGSNEETTALPCILIYQFCHTTFDDDVPALPRWTAPPATLVSIPKRTLLVLFAGPHLSPPLTFCGTRKAMIRLMHSNGPMTISHQTQPGSRTETGTITEHFDNVVESLTFTSTLHAALLSLSCPLSRYLGGGIILPDVLPYLCVVVAGSTSISSPGVEYSSDLFPLRLFLPCISDRLLGHSSFPPCSPNTRQSTSQFQLSAVFFDVFSPGSPLPFAAARTPHWCLPSWASCGQVFGCSHLQSS